MAETVSSNTLAGLLAIHRYRFLSVDQFARASDLRPSHVRDVLRVFERKAILGSIGNVGLRGGSKAPKLYYLTRSGYQTMLDAGGLFTEEVGQFRKAHTSTKWTPVMAHRMATIDVLLAAENALKNSDTYRVVDTRHEYRRVKRGRHGDQPETSDFVAKEEISENRVVPDAAFVIERFDTSTRGLFLVELDRGTERLSRGSPSGYSISDKFQLFERYLTGGRFAQRYSDLGEFQFFTLLFVTTTETRIANTRHVCSALSPALHPYFKLATIEDVRDRFLEPIWWGRDAIDDTQTPLLKSPNSKETEGETQP